MMTPVARLILVKSYPRNQLVTVMNFAVIPALVAPLLGPLMGGYIPIGLLGLLFSDSINLEVMSPFQRTVWVMGIVTILSGLSFLRLNTKDGMGLY